MFYLLLHVLKPKILLSSTYVLTYELMQYSYNDLMKDHGMIDSLNKLFKRSLNGDLPE